MGDQTTTVRMRLGIIVLAIVSATALNAQAVAPSDALLSHVPKSACFVVYADDAAAAAKAFTTTRFGAMICGAEFDSLRAELLKMNRATALQLRPAFGLAWSDVAAVHGPAVILAVPLADHTLGWAFMIQGQAKEGESAPAIVAAEKAFKEQGFQELGAPGAQRWLTTFSPPESRQHEAARATFIAGSYCGVATAPAVAEAVFGTRANDLGPNVGEDNSLENDADFQSCHIDASRMRLGDGTVSLFIRPLEFAEAARGRAIDPKPSAKDRLAAAKRLGFGDIRAVGATFGVTAGGFWDWELEAHVPAKKPLPKAMRLLSLTPGHLPRLPTWLAADFSSVWLSRVDFPAAMQGYGNLYDEANEPGPDGEGLFDDVLNGLRDDPEGVRVDLRKDVFAALGPEAVRVNYDSGWVFSIAMQDAPRVLSALSRFYKNDKRVKHEAAADYELWTVGPGASLFVEGQGAKTPSIRGIAVKAGELLVGLDPDRVRAAVTSRETAARINADADWKADEMARLQAFPATAARGLLHMERVLGPAYGKAIAASADAAEDDLLTDLWRVLLFGTVERSAKLPFAAAPPFDRLKGGFSRSGATISTADNGFTIRLGAPRHADGK